jgi:hypothetical protein
LYAVGVASIIGIFFALFMASQNTNFLHDMYSRWWQ